LAFAVLLWVAPITVRASDLLEDTFLIDLRAGTARSDIADALGSGGYELSDGRRVDLQRFYRSRWRDLDVTFLTQISDRFGLVWGISTGERGRKYRIAPALRLGFIAQWPVGRRGVLTVTAETFVGGELEEFPCVADYGSIGGVQAVNCRLAATELPPSETLRALVRVDAARESTLRATLEFRF
jgi:hypothetical protein